MSGRGQIIDKGRGVWMVRAPLGREPGTGKRLYHSKTIHGTKRDAQQYLTRVLRELDDGTHVEQSRVTVRECLEEWLEVVAKPRVSPRTLEDYSGNLSLASGVSRRFVRSRSNRSTQGCSSVVCPPAR